MNERSDILLNLTPDEILQYGETYFYRGQVPVIYNAGTITQVPSSTRRLALPASASDREPLSTRRP